MIIDPIPYSIYQWCTDVANTAGQATPPNLAQCLEIIQAKLQEGPNQDLDRIAHTLVALGVEPAPITEDACNG